MSRENVEAFRRIIAAFSRGDREGFFAEQHPDAETIPMPDWPDQGPYVGAAQWAFYTEAEDIWRSSTGPTLEDMEIIDAGEDLFVGIPRVARGRDSDAPIPFTVYGAATFREGKLACLRWFLERKQALEAVGLRE